MSKRKPVTLAALRGTASLPKVRSNVVPYLLSFMLSCINGTILYVLVIQNFYLTMGTYCFPSLDPLQVSLYT